MRVFDIDDIGTRAPDKDSVLAPIALSDCAGPDPLGLRKIFVYRCNRPQSGGE